MDQEFGPFVENRAKASLQPHFGDAEDVKFGVDRFKGDKVAEMVDRIMPDRVSNNVDRVAGPIMSNFRSSTCSDDVIEIDPPPPLPHVDDPFKSTMDTAGVVIIEKSQDQWSGDAPPLNLFGKTKTNDDQTSDCSIVLEGPVKKLAASESEESSSEEDSSTSSSSNKTNSSESSTSSSSDSGESETDSDDNLLIKTVSKKSVRVKLPTIGGDSVKGKLKRTLSGAVAPNSKLRKGGSSTSIASTRSANSSRNVEHQQEDDQVKVITGGVIKKKSTSDALVAQFLKRWWYALPPWPPVDYDYNNVLRERKLKWVSLEEWEDAEDVDDKGYTKVYQISSFPGIFRDPAGNAIDIRPREGRPSYKNIKTMSRVELLRLISRAIQNQLVELKRSPYDETITRRNLNKELVSVNQDLAKVEQKEETQKGSLTKQQAKKQIDY